MQFKPLRAAKACSFKEVANQIKKWGRIYVSVKLDGIRVLNINGILYTRKLEVVPSKYLQETFGGMKYHGLDGEMLYGDITAPDVFNKTQSAVMSEDNPDAKDCVWILYDSFISPKTNFAERRAFLDEKFKDVPSISIVEQNLITTLDEFKVFEQNTVDAGYEGVMGRNGSCSTDNAIYKFGDATLREGYLWKYKRFVAREAILTGAEEQMKNNNPATRDKLGRLKRASCKANKVGTGKVGVLLATDVLTGDPIRVGTGLTDKERQEIWDNLDTYTGCYFTYTQQMAGKKNKPRFPAFKSFRDTRDILEAE